MRNFKKNTLALTLLIVGFIIAIAGVTYAVIAVYDDIVGKENNTLVMGDIYMRYNENNQLTLENALPSEGPDETKYFEFTVSGKNTYTEKDIYYEIVLSHGDNHQTKTERIRDDLLRFRLIEIKDNQETIVVDNQSYNDLTSQRIWVNTISKDSKDEIDVTYRLYMWIDYNTVIGGGDADYDYDMDTWNNQVYGSIKVNVKGDLYAKVLSVKTTEDFKTFALGEKTETTITDEDGTVYLSGTNDEVNYNYVWYSGKLWRITAINPDGTLKMITETGIPAINWGTSATVSSSDLTSAYSTSNIREWLNQKFLPSLYNYQNIIVTDYTDKSYKWNATRTTSTSTKPAQTTMITDSVGLLSPYEYYQSYRTSGTTYSTTYLKANSNWWLITAYNSSNVHCVSALGSIAYSNPSSNSYDVRPVINLLSTTELINGTGTKTDPYKIKGDYILDEEMTVKTADDFKKYAVYKEIGTTTTDTDDIIYLSGSKETIDYNYVWYSGKLWRITAIYPDGTMKMITDGMITSIAFGANSKFYTDEENTSYMYQWLNQEFLPTLYNYENIIVEDATWNVSPGNGQEEVLVNASVGLLNIYEYYKSYQNTDYLNGYLKIGYYWWLLNPYSASSSYVWNVGNNGNCSGISPSEAYGVRPSIYLKSGVQLVGGLGTVDNPYRIKGDGENIQENVTLINSRGSGEYVKLSDEETAPTFRIVGTETINGAISTKLVLNDYVRDTNDVDTDRNTTEVLTRAFGTTTSWSSASETDPTYWRGYLNNIWIKEVDPTYNLENGTFGMLEKGTYYLGSVDKGYNYKTAVCMTVNIGKSVQDCIDKNTEETSTIQTSVMEYSGLLRYGEMFASQFGTGSGNSSNMWLITSTPSAGAVWYIFNDNRVPHWGSSGAHAVRPTINLKSEIVVKSGSGTEQDPFVVGLPN